MSKAATNDPSLAPFIGAMVILDRATIRERMGRWVTTWEHV